EGLEREAVRELGLRRLLLELDRHPVVAAQLAHPASLEQPVRTLVGSKRERLQLPFAELSGSLLAMRDQPRTEAAATLLRMHEAVELERLAVCETGGVGDESVVLVEQPRVVLEIHHAPPAEQLGHGGLRPALHRNVRRRDQLVDGRGVADGCLPNAET